MVDKIENQSVDFLGEVEQKAQDLTVMDMATQQTLVEISRNYNKMVNNMFKTCAQLCLKNFAYPKMSDKEQICAENCQKKFFATYAQGYDYVKLILEETQKTDFFADKDEVDIVKSANKAKLI